MTEEIFREDAYVKQCEARVTAVDDAGIHLDRTVFYPMGGGQPGDTGFLRLDDGSQIPIADTRKDTSSFAENSGRSAASITVIFNASAWRPLANNAAIVSPAMPPPTMVISN